MLVSAGLKAIPISLHLVFTGNPGTGKTTVARLVSKIYKELGILSKGQLVEKDRSRLIAEYTGQTLPSNESHWWIYGRVLFIDEAYTIVTGENDGYGKEAVATLLKAMEDRNKDFVVIVAGYPNEMIKFINSNPDSSQDLLNSFSLMIILQKICLQYLKNHVMNTIIF